MVKDKFDNIFVSILETCYGVVKYDPQRPVACNNKGLFLTHTTVHYGSALALLHVILTLRSICPIYFQVRIAVEVKVLLMDELILHFIKAQL